jgi:hypothetical protein
VEHQEVQAHQVFQEVQDLVVLQGILEVQDLVGQVEHQAHQVVQVHQEVQDQVGLPD